MTLAGAFENPEVVETEDVTYQRGGAKLTGYLARPRAAGQQPGIVLIHEAFGIDGHIRDVARRFAAAGYVTLAPELYSRIGRPAPGNREEMFAKMFALRDDDVRADVEAAAALLRGRNDSNGRVGIVGFCFGGRTALLAACTTTAFDATVDCWGGFAIRGTVDHETTPERPVPVIDLLPNLHGRLLVAVGGDDVNPSPADAEEIRNRLEKEGKDGDVVVFEGAGHAFFNDRRPDFYRKAPAHRLWDRMLAFLKGPLAS
jgi:carboxymethylenebutenolidase